MQHETEESLPDRGPTVAVETIRSHLMALEHYLQATDRQQEYLTVNQMVSRLLVSFDGLSRVPAGPIGHNLDLISDWLGEPNLGLRLAPHSSRQHPHLDFFFHQKLVTLRDYCHMLKRYLGITTEVLRLAVTDFDGSVCIRFEPNPDIYVSRHQVEGAVASVCDAVMRCYGISPGSVALVQEASEEAVAVYTEVLGLRPEFSADCTHVEFSCHSQRRESNSGGPVSADSFREVQKLERLHRQECDDQTWTERCRFLLGLLLRHGEPTKTSVADILAVTPRTLQRRLANESTSFRDILNDVRRTKAQSFLADTDLTMEDIAFLLGFKDTVVFFRSFKVWTGMTPGQYRSMVLRAT